MDSDHPRSTNVIAISLMAGRQRREFGNRVVHVQNMAHVCGNEIPVSWRIQPVCDTPMARREVDDLQTGPSTLQHALHCGRGEIVREPVICERIRDVDAHHAIVVGTGTNGCARDVAHRRRMAQRQAPCAM